MMATPTPEEVDRVRKQLVRALKYGPSFDDGRLTEEQVTALYQYFMDHGEDPSPEETIVLERWMEKMGMKKPDSSTGICQKSGICRAENTNSGKIIMKSAEEWIKSFDYDGAEAMTDNLTRVRKIQVDAMRSAADLRAHMSCPCGRIIREKADELEGKK